jgi:long-chain fatty acid transport protein
MIRFIVAAATVLLSTTTWATNGLNLIGFGARSSALGGVNMALTGDPHMMNGNPADIIAAPTTLHGDFGVLLPWARFTNDMNDMDADREWFPLPNLSFVYRPSGRLALGLGAYAQGGMGATYDLEHAVPTAPGGVIVIDTLHYHSTIAYLKAAPTVAYDVAPGIAVGGTFNVGYARIEMQMPFAMPPQMMAEPFGTMLTDAGYDELSAYVDFGDALTGYTIGGRIGFLLHPNDDFAIGATYVFPSTISMSGSGAVDMTDQFGVIVTNMVAATAQQYGIAPDSAQVLVYQQFADMGVDISAGAVASYDADVEMRWPAAVGFGVKARLHPRVTLYSDAKFTRWSGALGRFEMELSNGTNENINLIVNGDPTDGSLEGGLSTSWHDVFAFAVGVEVAANDRLDLRFGFNHGDNPIPDRSVFAVLPAILENHLTAGFGYVITSALRTDFAVEYGLTNTSETGESVIANEYDNSTNDLGGVAVHVNFGCDF